MACAYANITAHVCNEFRNKSRLPDTRFTDYAHDPSAATSQSRESNAERGEGFFAVDENSREPSFAQGRSPTTRWLPSHKFESRHDGRQTRKSH
jgi:hypothetical protein